jgi:hypothetical protein
MKKIFIAALVITTTIAAKAQDETDVLRYSQLQNYGTARSMGIGGAVGNIGADYSAIIVNPAGLARYSKSEFMLTTSFKNNAATATFLEGVGKDDKTKLALDNIALVLANRRSNRNGWRSGNFALGIQRVADFNRNTYIKGGINTKTSIANTWAQQANDAGGRRYVAQFGSLQSAMAYENYLLDTLSGNPDSLFSFVPTSQGIIQSKTVIESGSIQELNFALAGNYNDKFYVGGSLNFPIVNYDRSVSYREQDATKVLNNFNDLNYGESLSTNGIGVNAKLGLIYLPTKFLRLGAAVHTGTLYNLSDIYDYSLRTNLENGGNYDIPFGNYNGAVSYLITSPARAILSAAGMVGKYGFITADYEFVNYTRGKLTFNDANASDADAAYGRLVNNTIDNLYANSNNLRLGAELRLKDVSLRGGYARQGSPFADASRATTKIDYSAGIGFRGRSFFADFAYVLSNLNQTDYLYVLNGMTVPGYTTQFKNNTVSCTIGWKF